MRALVRSTLLAAVTLVPLGVVQSANAAMHAKLAGVVTKEDMAKQTVTLKTTGGKSFLVYTNKATKYSHLQELREPEEGPPCRDPAQVRESDHTYWAVSIAKM